jgi:hypothetical protein
MTDDAVGGQAPRASDTLGPGSPRRERPLSPAGTQLQNFFAAMNAVGGDAEDEYQAALRRLRADADLAVIEIARAENDCGRSDYPSRWACVHAAAELRDAAALPFLRSIVLRPIPPEESDDPHSFSTVAEETILRTTAVEGVGALAKEGAGASDALLEFLSVDSLSVRRAAVQSLLATPRGRRLRKRIESALPESQRFLLDLEAIDVREAPQVKRPQRHLSEAGRRARVEPSPRLPGDEPHESERYEPGPSRKE